MTMTDQRADEIQEVLADLEDANITRHGFTASMRDYEIVAEVSQLAAESYRQAQWQSPICVTADLITALPS